MVNIYGSGGGGVTQDEVTATRADVLRGYTTITSDSDDEIVEGTLADISIENAKTVSSNSSNLVIGITSGGHVSSAGDGWPTVVVPLADLRRAIGNPTAANILTGTTIAGLAGTMPNNGHVSQTLAINATYTIPKGYHDGTGTVSCNGTYSTKTAFTYTPGVTKAATSNQTIQTSGVYMSGNITVKGDQNLKAENIRRGVTIFGITGTYEDKYTNQGVYS